MKSSSCTTLIIAHLSTLASKLENEDDSAVLLCCCLCFKSRLYQSAVHSGPLKARLYHNAKHYGLLKAHSRPQSPRSFWFAPRIETSGRGRSRKSANHGLPAFVRSLRNLNNNGYYRLQKWAAIALARYLAPARINSWLVDSLLQSSKKLKSC